MKLPSLRWVECRFFCCNRSVWLLFMWLTWQVNHGAPPLTTIIFIKSFSGAFFSLFEDILKSYSSVFWSTVYKSDLCWIRYLHISSVLPIFFIFVLFFFFLVVNSVNLILRIYNIPLSSTRIVFIRSFYLKIWGPEHLKGKSRTLFQKI